MLSCVPLSFGALSSYLRYTKYAFCLHRPTFVRNVYLKRLNIFKHYIVTHIKNIFYIYIFIKVNPTTGHGERKGAICTYARPVCVSVRVKERIERKIVLP